MTRAAHETRWFKSRNKIFRVPLRVCLQGLTADVGSIERELEQVVHDEDFLSVLHIRTTLGSGIDERLGRVLVRAAVVSQKDVVLPVLRKRPARDRFINAHHVISDPAPVTNTSVLGNGCVHTGRCRLARIAISFLIVIIGSNHIRPIHSAIQKIHAQTLVRPVFGYVLSPEVQFVVTPCVAPQHFLFRGVRASERRKAIALRGDRVLRLPGCIDQVSGTDCEVGETTAALMHTTWLGISTRPT